MADRGLVYVLPDKIWFYCRHTGPYVIDSLKFIHETHGIKDITEMLYPYDEVVKDSVLSYSGFLCRMVEVDFEKGTITLKDEPYEVGDPTVMQRPRKVKWTGSFEEFRASIDDVNKIWNGMFAG